MSVLTNKVINEMSFLHMTPCEKNHEFVFVKNLLEQFSLDEKLRCFSRQGQHFVFLERENSAFLSSTIYVNPSRIMEVYTTNFSGIFFYLQRASRDFDETLPL